MDKMSTNQGLHDLEVQTLLQLQGHCQGHYRNKLGITSSSTDYLFLYPGDLYGLDCLLLEVTVERDTLEISVLNGLARVKEEQMRKNLRGF